MNKNIAIIGNGWVGKAMQQLFPEACVYVRNKYEAIKKGEILEDGYYSDKKELINQADVAFICVPTPNLQEEERCARKMIGEECNGTHRLIAEGKLDTSAVEECIAWCECPLIVIRSTVNPGDCDYWTKKYGKNIVFQPEYLGETPAHPLLNTKQTNFMILGGDKRCTRRLIELYQSVYNATVSIRQVTRLEAEIIKLTENRAIAFKVAQCQELYDACRSAGVDYYTIRDAVYGDDPRFDLWFTFVYPDKRGFNSKCIPKDVYAWAAWAESNGYKPKVTRAMLEKNKEWIA